MCVVAYIFFKLIYSIFHFFLSANSSTLSTVVEFFTISPRRFDLIVIDYIKLKCRIFIIVLLMKVSLHLIVNTRLKAAVAEKVS